MKPLMARFIIFLTMLAPLACMAQDTPVQEQVKAKEFKVYLQNQLLPVTNIQASPTGALGNCTYYYWVVANYTIGTTSPGGPSAPVTSSNCTLSGSNYNIVSWPANTAVSTYDVLRTATPTPPTGACACAVATGVTTNSQTDQSNSLGAYTVLPAYSGNKAVLGLINQPISSGVSHLWLVDSTGAELNDLNNPSVGSLSFANLTSGNNITAAMSVGTGASLITAGSGVIAATEMDFSGLLGSTNTSATMFVGTGASLGVSGSGTIVATSCPTCSPTTINSVDLTAQNAAISATNLNPGVLTAGQYRVSWNAKVTTPATTGAATSTLGGLTIVYTDPDGTVQTVTSGGAYAQDETGNFKQTNTVNSTSTYMIGIPFIVNVEAATNITYAFGYASNTASQMQYNLHIKLEKM